MTNQPPPSKSLRTKFPKVHSALLVGSVFAAALSLGTAQAQTRYWDTSQVTPGLGGTGVWENGGPTNWNSSSSGSTGGTFSAWNNADADPLARFGGTAGTVTINAPVTTGRAFFDAGGYVLEGGALTFNTGPRVFLSYEAGSGTNTISSDITVNGTVAGTYTVRNVTTTGVLALSGDVVVSGTGNKYLALLNTSSGQITLSGDVSATAGTIGLRLGNDATASSGGTYVIGGNNVLTNNSEIGKGTVLIENNNAFNGSSSISVGTSVATQTSDIARLLTNGAHTVAQNIDLGAGTAVSFTRVVGGNSAHNSEFSGNLTFANASTTVQLTAATGGRVDFSGLITDGGGSVLGSVEKTGNGVVRLTRAAGNTYDGRTTVSNGTLLLMNTSNSATGTAGITVASGATLGGTGIATGEVLASASGSRFAPGDSGAIGVLNLTGGLIASTGATFDFQINGAAIDQINFGAGALSLSGEVTFNFTSLGSVLEGTTYSLFTGSGAWTGVDGAGLTFNFVAPTGYLLDTSYGAGNGYVWNTTTRELSVQFAAVPEPSVVALALLGLGVLVIRRMQSRRMSVVSRE